MAPAAVTETKSELRPEVKPVELEVKEVKEVKMPLGGPPSRAIWRRSGLFCTRSRRSGRRGCRRSPGSQSAWWPSLVCVSVGFEPPPLLRRRCSASASCARFRLQARVRDPLTCCASAWMIGLTGGLRSCGRQQRRQRRRVLRPRRRWRPGFRHLAWRLWSRISICQRR